MAHNAQSYKLDEKKKAIILYENETASNAEQQMINYYLDKGYTVKFETKKKTKTVEEMREELKADTEVLKKFEKAYATKTEKGNKDFKETGFAKACKIYNDWKKANK